MPEAIHTIRTSEGKYDQTTLIEERDCPECGYDRAVVDILRVPGVGVVVCNACNHEIETW